MPENSFTIESDIEKITFLGKEVTKFLINNNIEKKITYDIELCLLEAINNVIRHSYKGKAGMPIQVDVKIMSDKIELKIIDSGISRTNFDKPVLDFDPDDTENLPEGGMGLYIIDQLMQSNSYEVINGENIYTLEKNLH